MSDLQTLPDLLARSVERHGDDIALVFFRDGERQTWTYTHLYERASMVADALAARGCVTSDRVVLWAPNSPDWVASFFGVLMLGAIVVPLDVRSGRDFVERVIARSEPRLILTTEEQATAVPTNTIPVTVLSDLDAMPANGGPRRIDVAPDDIAELVFTSGTTGAPKGVILTHRNILSDLAAACAFIPPEPRYRMLSLLPLSHMLEQIAELFFALSAGARVVYVDSLQPNTIFSAMREEGINGLAVVPTILSLFMSGIEREVRKRGGEKRWRQAHRIAPYLPMGLRRLVFRQVHERLGGRLEFAVSGGAFLDPALAQRWENLGVKIVIGYGMTEASPIVTLNSLARRNLHSVGRAISCCELTIGAESEILVRGENVTRGYWNDDEATRSAFIDGWYRTGDLGRIDEHGWLYLRGRLKNMIVLANGMNVYPEDIENVLLESPAVETAVVLGRGQGDDVAVHAVLVLRKNAQGDPAELVKATNARLAPHQRIKDWTVWPADQELPMTHTLKPKRADIARRIDQGAGARPIPPDSAAESQR